MWTVWASVVVIGRRPWFAVSGRGRAQVDVDDGGSRASMNTVPTGEGGRHGHLSERCPQREPSGHQRKLTRSILALGGHKAELTGHTKGALRNGLTVEEIREAVGRSFRTLLIC